MHSIWQSTKSKYFELGFIDLCLYSYYECLLYLDKKTKSLDCLSNLSSLSITDNETTEEVTFRFRGMIAQLFVDAVCDLMTNKKWEKYQMKESVATNILDVLLKLTHCNEILVKL